MALLRQRAEQGEIPNRPAAILKIKK